MTVKVLGDKSSGQTLILDIVDMSKLLDYEDGSLTDLIKYHRYFRVRFAFCVWRDLETQNANPTSQSCEDHIRDNTKAT